MAWSATLCYVLSFLVPSHTEQQTELFVSHYLLKVKLYFPPSTHQITSATWFSPVSYLLIVFNSVKGHSGTVENYLLGL